MSELRRIPSAKRPLILAAFASLAVAGCSSEDATSPTPAGSLVVSPARLVLGVGMSRQLSATLLDASGEPAPGGTISFISSDPNRASVTDSGLASYVGAGGAEIKVSGGDLTTVVPYSGLQAGHPQGTMTSSVPLPGDGPFGAAVDASGRIFISQANSGQLASDLYPVTRFTTQDVGGVPTSIALLAGGTALLTPTGPDTTQATVIDLSANRVLAQVPLGVSAYSAVTSPDSMTAYLGTNDGRVLVFDVASSQVTGSIDLALAKSRANHLTLNANGTLLYASSFTTGTISEIDLASKSVARLFIVGGEPQGIALSSDGTELYVADESGKGAINIYDLVSDTLESSIPSGATESLGGPFALAISPDGAMVYVGVISTEGPGLIHVIDTSTRTITRTINSCGGKPRRIAFGFSGGLAVIADETGCATFVE
jgi:DNA-binding beta-propeller fold protein YncE